MSANDFFWDSKSPTHYPNLVLKQGVQGLDYRQLHEIWKTAHVVVGLDGSGRTFDRNRLNYIRIDGALAKPLYAINLMCFVVKYFNKCAANGLSFRFWIGQSCQGIVKTLLRIDTNDVQPQVHVGIEYLFVFIFAKQAIVHKDTGQLLANSSMNKGSSHGGVYSTRKAHHHLISTYFFL